MSDIDARIAEIRKQADDSRRDQARAAASRDQAQGALEAVRKALREEFGVTGAEEAQALLASLAAEQEAEAQRVTALLAKAGGGS